MFDCKWAKYFLKFILGIANILSKWTQLTGPHVLHQGYMDLVFYTSLAKQADWKNRMAHAVARQSYLEKLVCVCLHLCLLVILSVSGQMFKTEFVFCIDDVNY